MKSRQLVRGIALGLAFGATAIFSHAIPATAGDVVKERRETMKTVVENFKPIVGMVKGAVAFDAATVRKNAANIAALLKKAKGLFPKGSDAGDTRAKPEIWQNMDEFNAIFDAAIKNAEALATVSAADALPPAVMALGGKGCKACHEKFRKPKKDKM